MQKRGSMPEASDFAAFGNASIVAPAGHGKTEIIAKIAGLGRRALILTHTHAGVHAIRARLKRLRIPYAKVSVDTVAGWSMRYAHAFPSIAKPPAGMPQGAEWDQLYRGVTHALGIRAAREVVAASYDRVLIDEYQDCGRTQHDLAITLSGIVPTLVFGDPMQGIFEFAGATLNWDEEVYPHFPLAGTLDTPHRWHEKNADLGVWIGETRARLLRGEPIDLWDDRITYRPSSDAFDMATLFEGIDGKEGSFAAIHCRKGICYGLARAASGGYQAIEEMAGNRLRQFSDSWDRAPNAAGRFQAIKSLIRECLQERPLAEGEVVEPDDTVIEAALTELTPSLAAGNGCEAASHFMLLSRRHSRWKLFRSELWRDTERALAEVAAGRAETMAAAAATVRHRVSMSGRRLPTRTVSTPLLLKGLEFDHVVIPDAAHFEREQQAQAKLFYVAISRATRSLVISSPDRFVSFPRP